jgi:hypothetical protein
MENRPRGMRTTLYSILCIVIRLGAVMLALRILSGAASYIGSEQSADFSIREHVVVGGLAVLSLLIAMMLWLYPGALARLASGRSAHQVFESPIDAGQIQWIAFSVLGMAWVMSGILDLAHLGYQLIWMSEMLGTGEEAVRRLHGQIAYDVFELLVGIALTLGARGLAGVLLKVRYVGSSAMPGQKSTVLEDSE